MLLTQRGQTWSTGARETVWTRQKYVDHIDPDQDLKLIFLPGTSRILSIHILYVSQNDASSR